MISLPIYITLSIIFKARFIDIALTSIIIILISTISIARSSDYLPLAYYIVMVISIIINADPLVIPTIIALITHIAVQYATTIIPREFRWVKYRELLYITLLFILTYPISIYSSVVSSAVEIDPLRRLLIAILILFAIYILLINIIQPTDLEDLPKTFLDKINYSNILSIIEFIGKTGSLILALAIILQGDAIYTIIITPIMIAIYKLLSSREKNLIQKNMYTPLLKWIIIASITTIYTILLY